MTSHPSFAGLIVLATLFVSSPLISVKAQNPQPAANAAAQTPKPAESEPDNNDARFGAITGKVAGEEGPIPFVNITVMPASGRSRGNAFRSVTTDEAGNFKVDGLRPIAWTVSASAQGYVPESAGAEEAEPPFHRIGDNVTIRMVKGGVITGRVLNARNEPVIAVRVSAQQVRDADGWPLRTGGFAREFQTDDRGVYRIFGLPAGAYVVVAGSTSGGGFGAGGGPGGGPGGRRPSLYEGDVPTYYPTATRDTAVELTVRTGEEMSGIDIQYRGEKGHAVSGKILGAASGSSDGGFGGFGVATSVTLTHAATGTVVGRAFVMSRPGRGAGGGGNGFALYGVPDGEYEIAAERTDPGDQNDAASVPRRVTVVSRDVTGVDLTLVPMGSINGKVQVERAAAASACQPKRRASIEEQLFAIHREDGGSLDPARPGRGFGFRPRSTGAAGTSSPDRNGDFSWRQLTSGRYRVVPQMLNENWYVRSVTLPVATNARAGAAAKAAAATAAEVGRNGLMLKSGERLNGLTITLAEGAAALKGKVVAEGQGKGLPPHLRVYLIPAEKEAADNVLRYAETRAGSDARFGFSNLSPGKYWLLAQPAEDEAAEKQGRPKAWDANERAKLRREAESLNQVIELQPCQRVADHTLQFQGK
ncbi:MAG TPA: carboxypeptidase-like regulatory domain-containing protein [Blastocatellia bacterium]|nr:carboxypeptidase-like regulatory domain-containing protein [Blastocatellia bacterium]